MNPSGQSQNQQPFPPQQPPQPSGGAPFSSYQSPNPSTDIHATPAPSLNTPQQPGFYSQPAPQAQPQWGQPQQIQPAPQPDNPWAQPPPVTQATGAIAPQPAGPANYGADYLDTIAPGPAGPKLFGGSFTWIIVGLAALLILAVSIISLGSGDSTATTQTVYNRLDNLTKVADKYKIYIKSGKLSSTNSNFKIFMTGSQRDLSNALTQSGVNLEKLDKKIKDAEATSAGTLTGKLEDARLNAILDRVYAREMAYQASQLLDLYKKMTKNKSKSIADAANTGIKNLTPIQKSFADFNETTD